MTTALVPLTTTVNGVPVATDVEPRWTLAELLRNHLRLTGTKVSCEMEVCGACTVLVDGRPVSSCTFLAADADGREVTTIEGLAGPDGLDPIQQAFVECFALQCGFCTPGFVLMAKALLADNPAPSRDEVIDHLEGNLCRCTGYAPIVEAILRAAELLRVGGPVTDLPESRASVAVRGAGATSVRLDAHPKVTGQAMYAIDLVAPGMLWGRAVRAERAHARIEGVDATEAMKVDGVVAVVTAGDLEGLFPRFGHLVADHPILAIGKVRYWGEPVALVLAESPHAASDGAELVRVTYDDLAAVMTTAEALAPDAPLLHEHAYPAGDSAFEEALPARDPSNVAHSVELGWGDVERALATAQLVVETEMRYPMLYAYAMEPYNALASYSDEGLEVRTTAQHPFMVRDDLARVFSLPLANVRVVSPFVGGGYGSKSYTKVEPLAAVGSWFTRRPVKVALDVEEAVLTTRADAAEVRVRTGFDGDGRIVARDVDLVLDGGAYADNGPLVLAKAANRCFGPYRVPNLRVRGRSVYTNTVPSSSYRGFGAPQGNLASEVNLDQAAERLGMDPLELRRRNLLERGAELLPGKRPLDADIGADLDLVAKTLQWGEEPLLRHTGAGIGCSASDAGAFPVSTAQVRLLPDGSVLLLSGSSELGQGSRTALAQLVAGELGVEHVRVVQSDTAATTYERTTGASRTTTLAGLAVVRACRDVRARLRDMAAEVLGCDADALADEAGGVRAPDGTTLGFAEILARWFGASAGEVTGIGIVRPDGDLARLPPFWEVGAVGVQLRVDPETGEVDVGHLVTVGDVGFAVNPTLVEGQDLGAATQGLGGALYEELVYDGPQLLNPNVVDYRVPRASDMPRRIDTLLAERGDGVGPYGAKGAGEGSLNPVGGAVAAAVARAVGRWPTRLPLTPERVWRLVAGLDDDDNER
jgi:CO/xanthine dehydrogenase Mo-binding subunit/aerobic-type carbon monoxide dehydrogenase small subunit (CoxS/CutS family)